MCIYIVLYYIHCLVSMYIYIVLCLIFTLLSSLFLGCISVKPQTLTVIFCTIFELLQYIAMYKKIQQSCDVATW